MKLARRLGACAAAAIFAGCSSPNDLPNTAGFADAAPAGAAKWDLLYVSNGAGTVTVYRYWQRTLHQVLGGFEEPRGECVDGKADVYVTDARKEKIFEFAHGGSKPIKVLSDSGYVPYACSIDPHSGNLAVANNSTSSRGAGSVAIYRHATGKPRGRPGTAASWKRITPTTRN